MRHLSRTGVLALVFAAGCGGAPAGPPTLTSEDVLSTAQTMAEQTRTAKPPSPTPLAATATPTVPLPTETPTATATPNFPVAIAKYNVSVRSGPGEAYEIVDLFLEGQTGQIVGRYDASEIGTWWLLVRIGQGINGWVWSGATDVSGDPAGIPVLEAPEPPD